MGKKREEKHKIQLLLESSLIYIYGVILQNKSIKTARAKFIYLHKKQNKYFQSLSNIYDISFFFTETKVLLEDLKKNRTSHKNEGGLLQFLSTVLNLLLLLQKFLGEVPKQSSYFEFPRTLGFCPYKYKIRGLGFFNLDQRFLYQGTFEKKNYVQ